MGSPIGDNNQRSGWQTDLRTTETNYLGGDGLFLGGGAHAGKNIMQNV